MQQQLLPLVVASIVMANVIVVVAIVIPRVATKINANLHNK